MIKDEHFPWERQADVLLQELWDPDVDANNQFIDGGGHVIPSTDPQLTKKQVMRNCLPWVGSSSKFVGNDLSELGCFNGI